MGRHAVLPLPGVPCGPPHNSRSSYSLFCMNIWYVRLCPHDCTHIIAFTWLKRLYTMNYTKLFIYYTILFIYYTLFTIESLSWIIPAACFSTTQMIGTGRYHLYTTHMVGVAVIAHFAWVHTLYIDACLRRRYHLDIVNCMKPTSLYQRGKCLQYQE